MHWLTWFYTLLNPRMRFISESGSATSVRSVIIVDDDPYIRRALCEFFTLERDFDVCGQAENGREAIEKAKRLHPDLIVTDLSMPVMNGLEEARVLKKLMPAIRVIMYTGHSDHIVEREARAVGVGAVISKSENVSALISKARTLLNRAVV